MLRPPYARWADYMRTLSAKIPVDTAGGPWIWAAGSRIAIASVSGLALRPMSARPVITVATFKHGKASQCDRPGVPFASASARTSGAGGDSAGKTDRGCDGQVN